MDDSEYYKKMRDGYSHYSFLFNKKKSASKVDTNTTHKQWENFQGREDAQMLQEKTNDEKLQNNESLSHEE